MGYNVIKDTLIARFTDLNIEVEVIYTGNKKDDTNVNVHEFVVIVPLDSETAFNAIESLNIPFQTTDGTYNIRQVESQRKEQTEGGYFGIAFDVERNCI